MTPLRLKYVLFRYNQSLRVQDLVKGELKFRVLGFRVRVLGFRVKGFGLESRKTGLGCQSRSGPYVLHRNITVIKGPW